MTGKLLNFLKEYFEIYRILFFFKVALSSQFQDKKFQCNTSKISHFMKKQKMKLSVFVFSYAKYSFAGAFCQAKTLKLGTSDCQ